MAPTTINNIDGCFYILGNINDRTDFSRILQTSDNPIAINVEGVSDISSGGVKRFLDFVRAANRQIHLHDVPTTIVEMFNVIPQLSGPGGKAVTLASVAVPFSCAHCASKNDLVIETSSIEIVNNQVKIPAQRCQGCKRALQLAVDPTDYFLFLTE